VGESQVWFTFYDPGANWFASARWTIISLVGFALSLAWLDRLEQREKRLARVMIEQPEGLAVPIAQ
jgi:fumarate reductase subunit D